MLFGTHMMLEEVGGWWDNVRHRMVDKGTEVTWVMFMAEFLEKNFPKDVRSKKEIEFLGLKYGIRQLLSMLLSSKSW